MWFHVLELCVLLSGYSFWVAKAQYMFPAGCIPTGKCFGMASFTAPSTFCCDGNSFVCQKDAATFGCCGKKIAPKNSLCCSGDVFAKSPGTKCCDKAPINLNAHVCCDGDFRFKMGPNTACCQKHSFNADSHVCCGKDIIPKAQAQHSIACQPGNNAMHINPPPPQHSPGKHPPQQSSHPLGHQPPPNSPPNPFSHHGPTQPKMHGSHMGQPPASTQHKTNPFTQHPQGAGHGGPASQHHMSHGGPPPNPLQAYRPPTHNAYGAPPKTGQHHGMPQPAGHHHGMPTHNGHPHGMVPQTHQPHGMPPQVHQPHGMPPQTRQPHGMPPQTRQPHGMPPQTRQPHGMPPQTGHSHGMPPQTGHSAGPAYQPYGQSRYPPQPKPQPPAPSKPAFDFSRMQAVLARLRSFMANRLRSNQAQNPAG